MTTHAVDAIEMHAQRFSELASLAGTLDRLMVLMGEALGDMKDPDVAAARVHCEVGAVVARTMGAIADGGCKAAGVCQVGCEQSSWLVGLDV